MDRQHNRQLMQAILHDRLPIAKIVNATVIGLDEAPKGYKDFDRGAAKKYVLDPNGLVRKSDWRFAMSASCLHRQGRRLSEQGPAPSPPTLAAKSSFS
jgi:hypothetical protein